MKRERVDVVTHRCLLRGNDNPVPREPCRVEKKHEVGKPRGVMSVSRETDCVTCGEYPEVQTRESACDELGKAREGMNYARVI